MERRLDGHSEFQAIDDPEIHGEALPRMPAKPSSSNHLPDVETHRGRCNHWQSGRNNYNQLHQAQADAYERLMRDHGLTREEARVAEASTVADIVRSWREAKSPADVPITRTVTIVRRRRIDQKATRSNILPAPRIDRWRPSKKYLCFFRYPRGGLLYRTQRPFRLASKG
tara:strand:+ start:113 stop:622 length:510 start_codon:yes stop_codon:yes gene_type:complete